MASADVESVAIATNMTAEADAQGAETDAFDDELWQLFKAFGKRETAGPRERCFNEACLSACIALDGCNYVCCKCGTLQGRFIDAGAEWRYFSGEGGSAYRDPSRCGMPTNDFMPEGSMSTFVGAATSAKNYRDIARITRYQMWNSMPYKERSMCNAIDHLTVRAVNSGISQVIIDEAKVLFKRICELHISRGDNRTGILASSIYVACKNNKVPRSAKEIATMFTTTTNVITRNCKKFQEVLQLRLACSMPCDFVHRFCSQMQLDVRARDACIGVVDRVQEFGLFTECSPTSVVAGAIFLVCEHQEKHVDKKNLAAVCGVSEITVTKVYKKLAALKEYLFFVIPVDVAP